MPQGREQEVGVCAPVLILSVARLNFEDEGTPNRHAWHEHGHGRVQSHLQATALGLIALNGRVPCRAARVDLAIPWIEPGP